MKINVILKKQNGTIVNVALPEKFKNIQNKDVLRSLLDDQIANAVPKNSVGKVEVLRDKSGRFAAVQYFTRKPVKKTRELPQSAAGTKPRKLFSYKRKKQK